MKLLAKISKHRNEHPLSYRLLTYILAFSSVFTLLGTGVQLLWQYRAEVGGIDDVLRQIESSHLGSLTTSQWLLDDKQTLEQMNGILRLPEVRFLEIRSNDEGSVVYVGDPTPGRDIRRTFPLIHEHRGQEVNLGELTVAVTLDGVYQRLNDRFLIILGTQAVKTFATSLFILFIVQFLFTRHLHTLGEHAKRLRLNELEQPLTLNRSLSRQPDEMDQVVSAMEEMRTRLIDDLALIEASAEERRQLIADLEAKNAEMKSFIYTVSHDLKSPLISVQGFLGLLRSDLDRGDMERAGEDIARISAAAQKMFDRVEDLLRLAQAGRAIGKVEDVCLTELAREAVELLSGLIEDRGARASVSPELPVVEGDRTRLLNVFQNLIENSIKFMGDQPEPRIEIGAREENGEIVCYVSDNGIGIERDQQENVFGLFSKLNGESAGTGIGLAIVQRIIAVHHGRLWIESEGVDRRGCTFCFALPKELPQEAL